MADLLPRSKVKGVDMCDHSVFHQFIIRSDLGCYMYSTDVHKGHNLTIYDLHPSCQGGDHYLASENRFFIIKGSRYRCVSAMNTDSDAAVYDLHPKCQGGEHYLSVFKHFFVIFQSRGVFRVTTDLTTYSNGTEYVLHPNCKDGLYYWATANAIFFIKPKGDWGVTFHRTCNLNEDNYASTFSVHPDILNFLPGGVAVTHGTAFAKWELIKTIANDSKTPITWEKRISRKVGYTKSKSSSMEHNWKMSLSASYTAGTLTEAIAKFQFSLTAEYGGAQVNAENQSWEEATETEEKVNLTLQPNEKIYVWQYKLGFGKEDVLFCRDIRFDDDPNPPTDVPLPPSNM
ncbi:hypothetical protein AMEX_G10627 [Astyanax mexicanus]|uniref:Uncharacterized protein n=1 Tax=Astyanax mexicanus TaxID=7994 RepID=A0A8T2LQB8_ASTMX|nr:hypothetical protein AMEX_G10627 [Astyanax mexicanus]